MSDRLVGNADCSYNTIVERILASESAREIQEGWSTLAVSLDTPISIVDNIRRKQLQHNYSIQETLIEILEVWRGRKTDGATIGELLRILETKSFNDASDVLRRLLNLPERPRANPQKSATINTSQLPRVVVAQSQDNQNGEQEIKSEAATNATVSPAVAPKILRLSCIKNLSMKTKIIIILSLLAGCVVGATSPFLYKAISGEGNSTENTIIPAGKVAVTSGLEFGSMNSTIFIFPSQITRIIPTTTDTTPKHHARPSAKFPSYNQPSLIGCKKFRSYSEMKKCILQCHDIVLAVVMLDASEWKNDCRNLSGKGNILKISGMFIYTELIDLIGLLSSKTVPLNIKKNNITICSDSSGKNVNIKKCSLLGTDFLKSLFLH